MSMYADYVATMQTQLKNWDANVDALAAESRTASDQARTAYETNLLQLRESRAAAQKTFQQLSAASESASVQMQAGMEGAWATMQKALEKVSSDLKTGSQP